MIEIGGHCLQVSVVDADQRGSEVEHAGKVCLVVQLHERRHAVVDDRPVEAPEVAVVEALGDQEHRVGPMGSRLDHLVEVDHELLAEHRQTHGRPGRLQISEAATEASMVGEHRDRRSPGGGIAPHDVLDGGSRPDLAGRRALPLELGDQPHWRPGRHRREEVSHGGRFGQNRLEHGQRHAVASDGHLPPLSSHDLVEDVCHAASVPGQTPRARRLGGRAVSAGNAAAT